MCACVCAHVCVCETVMYIIELLVDEYLLVKNGL